MMAKIGFSLAVLILTLAIGVAAGVYGARVMQPPTSPRPPEPSPANVAALRATPTPLALPTQATPTPDTSRQMISAFIPSYQDVSLRWDSFRKDYRSWLTSETTCTPAAMVQEISGLVTRFAAMRERARGLSRTALTRSVVDSILDTADRENQALTRLRDAWKPNDQGPFLAYEQERRDITQARRKAVDQAAWLKTVSVAERQQSVAQLSSAWESVARDWDAFHRDWDTWRGQDASRSVAQTAADLPVFSQRFQGILTRLQGLPRSSLVIPVAEALVQAADREGSAMERLRGRFKPDDSALFESFERDRRLAAAERRKAVDRLDELTQQTASERQDAVDAFNQAFATLNQDWDTFDSDYDVWRNKNGNCQRDTITSKLADFTNRFKDIMAATQGVRRASPAKPLADLLADAAQRELSALQGLRDTWRPYDDTAIKAYEREQVTIDDLRARVAVGLQEVAERYGLTVTPLRSTAEAAKPARSP
ncbi:MAG: hypothetical protein HY684_01790 [Chloroflexi bacterium]|nr:hypothetical protein [Chloroflexota bacterium]